MFIERIVSEGLAHFSYIAGNDNRSGLAVSILERGGFKQCIT